MIREQIISRKNPLLQQIRKLLSDRSFRQKMGLYVADGVKLLGEVVRWAPEQLRTVVVTADVDPGDLPEHVRLVEVPRDVMETISPMEAPQGALFVCAIEAPGQLTIGEQALVLDGIQDPGNLGTMLRTADAMEIPVIVTPGCADLYNHKTVRASMGAVFRTGTLSLSCQEVLELCQSRSLPLYATALSPRAVDLRQVDLRRGVVVIGSEGRGVSSFFLEHATGEVIIPMNPRCESLNAAAAAAMLLWEMRR